MLNSEVGESVPPDTAHAISVSLPTWKANVGYEEGQRWVVERLTTGYPRFFVHKSIEAFSEDVIAQYGKPGQRAMLFPTKRISLRCVKFMREKAPEAALADLDVVHVELDPSKDFSELLRLLSPSIHAVIFSGDAYAYAKQYWQHTGDGISSRRAEFCHGLFRDGVLVAKQQSPSPPQKQHRSFRGPKRYQRPGSLDLQNGFTTNKAAGNERQAASEESPEALESARFLEERFGRNLDVSLVNTASSAIKRRIAGALTHEIDLTKPSLPAMDTNSRGIANLREDDIYLYPGGMNAIFNAHQALLHAREPRKSIEFGFPYVDTLKILEKWGPGCQFYGHASTSDLDDLEERLQGGERFLALFCEFPGNPVLTCPDLVRIRRLAESYDFAVVIDETIGTFLNIDIFPYADIVVSSLSKIFSGESNVMGGSGILNPGSRYYGPLKAAMRDIYEDTYWAEDVLFMERNSRDFVSRIDRVNANAETICEVLKDNPLVEKVYYPKYNDTRQNYDNVKTPNGGYGGLLSVVFYDRSKAIAFFDALDTHKGPSLGTNFTLTSPYVILAHYTELDWARSLGVNPDLVRISVGLEEPEHLKTVFSVALRAAEQS